MPNHVKPLPSKFFLESNTVRGIILATSPLVRALLASVGVEAAEHEVIAVLTHVASLVGLLLALYGRMKADTSLRLKK